MPGKATYIGPMIDPFGRHISYLRVSVTDRCDFRCVYCMAEDMTFLPKAEVLSLEELERLCAAFIRRGVTHTSSSLDPPTESTRKRSRDEKTEAFLHMKTTATEIKDFVAGNAAQPPRPRVFSRLVMETYGWPIKFFKDIPELLSVVRDAIQGMFDY